MEIIMDKTDISCRREIWSSSVRREEMVECVVPDTYPDICRIIDVCSETHIRGKEASAGKVTVEAVVMCSALYVAEGSACDVFRLESEIPFSVTVEVPEATEETDIVVKLELEDLEVRVLNPRKILSRAELCAQLRCFNEDKLTVDCSAQCEPGLEMRKESSSVALVTDVREKTFVISDELMMPPMHEGYARLLCHKISLTADDVKFVGNKLIFKGEAEIKVLAEPEGDQKPVCFTANSSFSQIMELSGEGESAEVILCLTGAYLQIGESDAGKPVVAVEMHILAQAVTCVEKEICYIADAYSNACECQTTSEEISLPQSTISMPVRDTYRSMLETEGDVVETIWTDAHCSGAQPVDGGVSFKMLMRCMYTDGEGALRTAEKTEELKIDAELPEGKCTASIKCGEIYASPVAGGIDIRISVEAQVQSGMVTEANTVTGIELGEKCEKSSRPSLYIIPCVGSEDMWFLAKKFGSTVALIEKNNPEPTDTLLIPVQCV